MRMNVILETKNLCKFYGTGENQVKAVDNAEIRIGQGEFVSLMGKSGSGKSTLLHMIGGLDHPTAGAVLIGGKSLFLMKEEERAIFRRRKIGFVFQAYNLVAALNVWENIVLPIGLDHSKADRDFVRDIVKTLGLESLLARFSPQLSGGQQQRVAIARALASKPDILLADEPTGNLDSRTGDEVAALLKMSAEKYGQTLIVVTHNEELAQMAARMIVIEDGKVIRS